MHYLDFLESLHQRLRPRTYLEIGVAQGHGLALSRCRSIGVDPNFHVDQQIMAPVSLIRATSDEYFARVDASGIPPFGDFPIDLAYIDGMHHFEYALRDFIAIERYATPHSVVAIDDVFPRSSAEAARQPAGMPWTGDVFHLPAALAEHRPDLNLILVDTALAGTLLVTGLDPESRVLERDIDTIVAEFVRPDPQEVPEGVLARAGASVAEEVLALALWDELRAGRESDASAAP